jgi:hypothetical protein
MRHPRIRLRRRLTRRLSIRRLNMRLAQPDTRRAAQKGTQRRTLKVAMKPNMLSLRVMKSPARRATSLSPERPR